MAEEPTTEQLRAIQSGRAHREAAEAEHAGGPAERRTHERRADKAAYLAEKLAKQEESERD